MAGGGRLKPQGRSGDGASVVEMVKMKFWKRGFGERSYISLERALRGEEDGVVGGGQDGVSSGGNGRENGEGDGLF